MLRNLCHRLDVRETFQRALPYHGKQQVALRLAFCPELRLGLFHLNDGSISLPSEMGLDLCGRLCHSCCVDPRHSSSVLRKAWLSLAALCSVPGVAIWRAFGIAFGRKSVSQSIILGEWLCRAEQCASLIHYRISAPPEVEELLLGGLTEPTWLSLWLLSAEGQAVPDLSCV